MKIADKSSRAVAPFISNEALIGLGTTIAALGLLGVLLGAAEMMRSERAAGGAWLAIGVVMLVLGAIAIGFAWSKRERR